MIKEKDLTQGERAKAIAEEFEISEKVVNQILNFDERQMAEELRKGNKVYMWGFGDFEVVERAARKGRNFQTEETIDIPATKRVVFDASPLLEDFIKS